MNCCLQFCAVVMVAASTGLTSAAHLPPYMKPCSRKDVNSFKLCAIKNGRQAIPTVVHGDKKNRLPDLNPMIIPEFLIDFHGLKFRATDVRVLGVEKSSLMDFEVNFDEHVVSYKIHLPRIEFLSKYSADGKISLLPIRGKGNFNLTMDNAEITFSVPYDLVKKEDNREYMALKEPTLDFTMTKARFYLGNLFDGNKLLGEEINRFFNENWRDLVDEFRQPVEEVMGSALKHSIQPFIERIPYDELFPVQ